MVRGMIKEVREGKETVKKKKHRGKEGKNQSKEKKKSRGGFSV